MCVSLCRNFEFLIPDAPELIASFLEGEQDMSCKRNAFLMLLHADQERALAYLASCLDQVTSFGDILQLVIVELIYKVCGVYVVLQSILQWADNWLWKVIRKFLSRNYTAVIRDEVNRKLSYRWSISHCHVF